MVGKGEQVNMRAELSLLFLFDLPSPSTEVSIYSAPRLIGVKEREGKESKQLASFGLLDRSELLRVSSGCSAVDFIWKLNDLSSVAWA